MSVYGPDGDELASVTGNLARGGDAPENALAIVVAVNLSDDLWRVAGSAREAFQQAHGFMHYRAFAVCKAPICVGRREALAALDTTREELP